MSKTRQISIARVLLENRMSRRRFLPLGIFSEHAWDALLTLFTAQVDDGRLTVAVVAERCGCSISVMLRWLRFLEEQGIVSHEGPGTVGTPYKLTAQGLGSIEGYLAATEFDAKSITFALHSGRQP